ncbi:MAG: hypothetical protein I3J02_02820 [Prevotella sp.]|nr:hypothetical protein [Prevotella sp.]
MALKKFLAIRRDDCFSPNSIEKDRDILQSVCKWLEQEAALDEKIIMVDEAEFANHPVEAECYVSMARSEDALQILASLERQGRRVVNSPVGVMRCQRSVLDELMREHHFHMPPVSGKYGFWLKRGDASAQSKGDVVFCQNSEALEKAEEAFNERGINEWVVSAHIPGDLVKFYGVGDRMFRYFYPNDDGISKFGDEEHNGKAHHYPFDHEALRREIIRLANLTGVSVYGGDVIISEDGRSFIIDFNDWPSFSRCKDEAAEAIARQIMIK